MKKLLVIITSLFVLAGCETYSVGGTVRPVDNVRVSVGVHTGYYQPYYYQPYYSRPVIVHRHVYQRPVIVQRHVHPQPVRDHRHNNRRHDNRQHDRRDERRGRRNERDRRRQH